jgi:anaerobic magnesium-protoporphyrin IX monomethyl ester cyclase
MKILFIELEMERDWAVASIGPAYLSAYVAEQGFGATLLSISIEQSILEAVQEVVAAQPDLVALSLTTRQWVRARAFLSALRQASSIPTIVGGLHPTFAPEKTLEKEGIDYLCLGEGEEAFLAFLQALEERGFVEDQEVDNIWVKGGRRPKIRPPIEPLDRVPFMDRQLLSEQYGVVHMVTQRGCPFPCTYCAARMYNEMYGDQNYGRRRSIEHVLLELEELKSSGAAYVIYLDDNFTINHKWIRDFLPKYKERIGLPFSIHARAETISKDLLARLSDAGCSQITYGVESGSERLRYEVMKRKVSNKRLIEAFQWSHELGIITTANYIIGTPTETIEDLELTIELHHQLNPTDFGYFIFYPYPGTPIYKTCQELGVLPSNIEDLPANHRRSVLKHDQLTPEDIEHYYQKFTELRKSNYLKRYGLQLAIDDDSIVEEQYQISAAQG